MIVVDASAALAALLQDGRARRMVAAEQLHAPHLVDSEVARGLRRKVATGQLAAQTGWSALDTWRRLGMTRYPVIALLDRVWELRRDVSSYDASYVALAELLDCALLTADERLARARGTRCPITVVPR